MLLISHVRRRRSVSAPSVVEQSTDAFLRSQSALHGSGAQGLAVLDDLARAALLSDERKVRQLFLFQRHALVLTRRASSPAEPASVRLARRDGALVAVSTTARIRLSWARALRSRCVLSSRCLLSPPSIRTDLSPPTGLVDRSFVHRASSSQLSFRLSSDDDSPSSARGYRPLPATSPHSHHRTSSLAASPAPAPASTPTSAPTRAREPGLGGGFTFPPTSARQPGGAHAVAPPLVESEMFELGQASDEEGEGGGRGWPARDALLR